MHPRLLPALRPCVESARLQHLGDAGRLLEALYFASETNTCESLERARCSLAFWRDTFCATYVNIVEERMRHALFDVGRKRSGEFARSSSGRFAFLV